MKVYLVTDMGVVSPCMGIIAGTFTTSEEAYAFKEEVETIGPQKYGFWGDNDVGVLELMIGEKQEPYEG